VRAYKFRIYTTRKQEELLQFTLNHCRWLYNTALQQRRDVYRSTGKSIGYSIQQNEMPLLKDQFPEYIQIHSQVLQSVLKRVDLAYQSFFRRIKQKGEKAGFPRFHGKEHYDSFTYPQSGFSFTKGKNRINLSKIGLVKIKLHRQIPLGTQIKTCTIKRESDKWYAIFSCMLSNPAPKKKAVTNVIGIDLGLTDFAVLSNGEEIANPKYLKQSEDKLKKIQSKYSKGKSKKVKRQIGNLYHKITNQRNDFQHKLSYKLVNTFDLIAYEDLKIKQMIEDNKFNLQKHISDAAWGKFIFMLKYKAENAGKYCIAVNPKGTTQRCSHCNSVVKKTLYERSHKCPACGFETTRDINAALNIEKLGISLVDKSVCSDIVHPFLFSEAASPLGKR
jgi:putative transposase